MLNFQLSINITLIILDVGNNREYNMECGQSHKNNVVDMNNVMKQGLHQLEDKSITLIRELFVPHFQSQTIFFLPSQMDELT